MTAKHRKGKNNHKHEDNFFKNDVLESEVRSGANNYALLLVLFLMMVIGGATGAWFCFQQHQTLTYLSDNLMGMQMKIVKLQASHEEIRQSSSKQHISESLETRLNALEESYALAQKQVGMALATAEQLRTSDLPAQVLSLHTEMKARLAEMQQATVSLEQLSQLQTMLKGKSEEFEGVRVQVEGLATVSSELSHKVEALTGSLGEAESRLEERVGQVSALSATLDGQASEVVSLKEQLDAYKAQLEASTLEMAAVREMVESEQSQLLQQANVEEQLNTVRQSLLDQTFATRSLTSGLGVQLENIQKQVTQMVGEPEPPAEPEEQTEEVIAPAAEEEAAAATNEEEQVEEEAAVPVDAEEEVSSLEEAADEEEEGASEGEAAALQEAPVEQEDSAVAGEAVPSEEVEGVREEDQMEQDEPVALSEEEEEGEDATETVEAEQDVGEEMLEEEAGDGETVEELTVEEDRLHAEEEESEGEEEQHDSAAEEETEETEEEEPLENVLREEKSCYRVILSCLSHSSLLQRLSALVVDLPKETMQAFVPRLYLTPVRDDEAESQRKARSRHARQTRRSTQGVTLTDLKEAHKISSLSPYDRQVEEEGGPLDEKSSLRKGLMDDGIVKTGLTESTETSKISPKWSHIDEQGNIEPRLEAFTETPAPNFSYSSVNGLCDLSNFNSSFRAGERWWTDENQNPLDGASQLSFATKQHQRKRFYEREDSDFNTTEHDRLSRYDSSGETATDKPLGRASSYTRRETRLASLNRQDQDPSTKDYKKMYGEALLENERLKSRLHDSKQELVKIRSQLEKVTQRQDRISERSSVLNTEKREKQALEKRVSNMEEEIKVLAELKSDNQRLKDENGALIRVISKLSK